MYSAPYSNQSALQEYEEGCVLSAEPLQLVAMLYGAALKSVGEARVALACGDIMARGRHISKACDVLMELTASLDSAGGTVTVNLARLYEYMFGLLGRAHAEQAEQPLVEVQQLLTTLAGAWAEIATAAPKIESPVPTVRSSQFFGAGDCVEEQEDRCVYC